MRILLANDDGIFSPGLAALEHELRKVGDVMVVAPALEQSGVGHSVTFLSPLIAKKVFDGERRRGWSVEGSPADCVKLGVFEFCEGRPDLVVSGMNCGLNAGINVLYSGTVAAAIEGAFFGITSVAVSLEDEPHADLDAAARLARQIIQQIVERKSAAARLYNVNIPARATHEPSKVAVVPMSVERYGEHFEKRIDPIGRAYYWATKLPPPKPTEHETDLTALTKGWITLTPLGFNLTKPLALAEMEEWDFDISI